MNFKRFSSLDAFHVKEQICLFTCISMRFTDSMASTVQTVVNGRTEDVKDDPPHHQQSEDKEDVKFPISDVVFRCEFHFCD